MEKRSSAWMQAVPCGLKITGGSADSPREACLTDMAATAVRVVQL
jgi:hypothetical protein